MRGRASAGLRPIRRVVLAVAILATITWACTWTANDTRSATEGLPDVEAVLQSELWVLDPASSTLGDIGGRRPTLVFEPGGRLGGSACQEVDGTYTVDEHTLVVGDLVASGESCDPALVDEPAYLAALAGEHEVDVTDRDRLVLTRDGSRLVFVAEDPHVLAGDP